MNQSNKASEPPLARGIQWVLGLTLGALLVLFLASTFFPWGFASARGPAIAAACQANLKGIGTACMLYAEDNSFITPASLDQLIAESLLQEKMLHCPLHYRDANRTTHRYLYARPLTDEDDPHRLIAYGLCIHSGGKSVGLVNGSAGWAELPWFHQHLRQLHEWQRQNRKGNR